MILNVFLKKRKNNHVWSSYNKIDLLFCHAYFCNLVCISTQWHNYNVSHKYKS